MGESMLGASRFYLAHDAAYLELLGLHLDLSVYVSVLHAKE
jgi:hypothetical protein